MFDKINQAIDAYQKKWQALVATRKQVEFFKQLKPTAIGWKTEDFPEFQQQFHELRDACDQIHLGWLNERWLATMHLRQEKLALGVEIVKLMQRRPTSKDAIGLDHVDFLIPAGMDAKTVLAKEPDLKWSEESNGEFCQWISIWFDGTEAKLRVNTTIDVAIAELQAINQKVVGS